MLSAVLVSLALAATPEVGKPAPEIDLEATSIQTVLPNAKDKKNLSLKDLKGKNVVLFFYPRAMTKGCTIESCGFRDVAGDFTKANTVILGISTDKLEAQQKFTDKEKLNFPLLADPEKKVTKAYGALNDKGVASRYTFIIDKDGVLRKTYTSVSPAKHPKEVYDWVIENLSK